MILAEKRVYEVIFIVDPDTQEEEMTKLTQNLSGIITDQGGTITRNEVLGRRQLAYRIGRKNEGVYVLFEIEGTGSEIAELERRMRVNDQIMRYMTVRVDEDRQRAEKLKARRQRKAAKRPFAAAAAGGGGGSASGRSGSGDGGE
ncbi:MAG: small subunit ribosomal protein [Acidobacteriota bacterium]|jgi:small subunit ribosomal protein S6|nr:small subunit ribosomal protein [Acidobacteriota bacterium]